MPHETLTPREELLVAGVNARLTQRKREARWWWLADGRDWARGAGWGFFSFVVPLGMLVWLSPSSMEGLRQFFPFGIAWFMIADARTTMQLRQQQATIDRLAERVKILEQREEA